MTHRQRLTESILLAIAFTLLCFGVPDSVPYNFKDAVLSAAIGALFLTQRRMA